jgi:broad specificity phosphatase PhoE
MKKIIAILLLVLALPAYANSVEIAKTDGAILLMRHALAPGTGDPEKVVVGDCSTQRNLSEVGRKQAREIGKRLAEVGITHVFTSQWCRTRETAELLNAGTVKDWPSLNSFFADRSSEPEQTKETMRLLSSLKTSDRPILVTHQVNISALTGLVPRSGEIIVVRIVNGSLVTLGRIPSE